MLIFGMSQIVSLAIASIPKICAYSKREIGLILPICKVIGRPVYTASI